MWSVVKIGSPCRPVLLLWLAVMALIPGMRERCQTQWMITFQNSTIFRYY